MNEIDPANESRDTILNIASKLSTLFQREAAACDTLVNELIESGSMEIAHIEALLDQTLDACAHDAALSSYKRLCSYYATINLTRAAFYANAYREMWGED